MIWKEYISDLYLLFNDFCILLVGKMCFLLDLYV